MTPTIKNPRIQVPSVLCIIFVFLFTYKACEPYEEGQALMMSVDHMEFVSEGSYKITGTLASLGEQKITGFGICWSESQDPDLDCSYEALELPLYQGEFSLTVSGLSPSTTYYFRAFAQMNSLLDYSEQKEFTTRPAAEDMVMDMDGNIYRVVKIGDQTWMAENLKSTMYSDKTPIPLVEDSAQWYDFTRESLGYCWYENVATHGYAYGGLYTWAAATRAFEGISTIEEGVQGVCPDGWHLPSDSEWKQLEMYLGMSQEEADAKKWRGTDQGGRLKDKVGFSALLGGYRHGSAAFVGISETARFWTSTQNGYDYAWYRGVDRGRTDVYRDFSGVYRGHSVRCVKDIN